MRRSFSILLLLSFLLPLTACAPSLQEKRDGIPVTDAFGDTVYLTKDARVVSCYASFAECWLLSGGSLVGVTSDALERGLSVGDAATVGSVKSIDLALVTSLSPDYVLLSADLAAHLELRTLCEDLSIPVGYFRMDSFSDYADMMASFTAVNERPDLYDEHVAAVAEGISAVRARIPEGGNISVLLMRAYTSGIKAKSDDNLAGLILREFGVTNIADKHPSLLTDLSVEYVINEDPDFIFVLTMGDETAARATLDRLRLDPAWSGLTAFREGRVYLLPKELFHYKPCNRWDDSYEYLGNILYPSE